MVLQGFVEVFWMFIALRVLLGIGEGVDFPAMNRALVDWMQPGGNLSLSCRRTSPVIGAAGSAATAC